MSKLDRDMLRSLTGARGGWWMCESDECGWEARRRPAKECCPECGKHVEFYAEV